MRISPRPNKSPPTTSPPPITLHPTHLTPTQNAYLVHNPTYSDQLAALTTLAEQVHLLRLSLAQRAAGKLPEVAASSLTRSERDVFEAPRRECRLLEEKLCRWDDDLAGLAEALLSRPCFGVGDEVVWREGCWWWRVPHGEMVLPRHGHGSEAAASEERFGLSTFPSPKFTKRITKLFGRSSSTKGKLQRRASTASRFVQ